MRFTIRLAPDFANRMKLTVFHHHHQSAGATWTTRHGWEIPAFFAGAEEEATRVRSGVGISDVSFLQKFEGQEAQTGSWQLGSKRHLIIGEPPIETPPGGLDITSVYAAFRLAGPQSRDVLRKLMPANLA